MSHQEPRYQIPPEKSEPIFGQGVGIAIKHLTLAKRATNTSTTRKRVGARVCV